MAPARAVTRIVYWPPVVPPPPPPRPCCCVPRSGCSALLAPAGLFDVVSAPVAAPAPVVVVAVPVEAGPEVAAPGDAPGGEDEVTPVVWARAGAAVRSAAAVKRPIFVIAVSLADCRCQRAIGHPVQTGPLVKNGATRGEVPRGGDSRGFSLPKIIGEVSRADGARTLSGSALLVCLRRTHREEAA